MNIPLIPLQQLNKHIKHEVTAKQYQNANYDNIIDPQIEGFDHNIMCAMTIMQALCIAFFWCGEYLFIFYFFVPFLYIGIIMTGLSGSCVSKKCNNQNGIQTLRQDFEKFKKHMVKVNFSITCYHNQKHAHYQRNRRSNRAIFEDQYSKTYRTVKVVTYQAKHDVEFQEIYDFSGYIKPGFEQNQKKWFTYIVYEPNCQYIQSKQEETVQKMFKNFVQCNTRDQQHQQQITTDFNAPQTQKQTLYFTKQRVCIIFPILVLAALLFLSYPIFVEKYRIKVTKKLKLKENQMYYSNIQGPSLLTSFASTFPPQNFNNFNF